jgi:hypothetical protein
VERKVGLAVRELHRTACMARDSDVIKVLIVTLIVALGGLWNLLG